MEKKPIKPLPKLEDVLAYEFPDLIHRFRDDWDLSYEEVEGIFTETKKFLWLTSANYHDRKAGLKPPPFQFTASTYMLDVMWHQFLLYTPDYKRFTHDFFGYFIGHAPLPREMVLEYEALKAADPEKLDQDTQEELVNQYAYIKEKLGVATYEKWYVEWAEVYSEDKLNALRKPIKLPDF